MKYRSEHKTNKKIKMRDKSKTLVTLIAVMLTLALIGVAITTIAIITRLIATTTMRPTATTTLVSASALILFEIIYFTEYVQ